MLQKEKNFFSSILKNAANIVITIIENKLFIMDLYLLKLIFLLM